MNHGRRRGDGVIRFLMGIWLGGQIKVVRCWRVAKGWTMLVKEVMVCRWMESKGEGKE